MEKKKIYRFPEQFPNPYYRYSYAPKNSFSRTPMQGGRARHRVENELTEMEINVEWKIPYKKMDSFLFFVHELVGNRSGWDFFELPIIFGSEIKMYNARFVDGDKPYTSVNESNIQWSVSAKLEVIGIDMMTEDDFYKENPIIDYSIIDLAVNTIFPICQKGH